MSRGPVVPLLGRPALPRAQAARRGLVLLVALLLASTPLSLILAGASWFELVATGAVPVLALAALLRLAGLRPVLVAVAELLVVVIVVIATEVGHGLVSLGEPVGLIGAQAGILTAAVGEIGAGLAPLTVGARGSVLVVLIAALVALVLDLLLVEMGWHTPVGLLLMGFVLLPSLQAPDGGAWWTAVGPILGGMMVLAIRAVHADPANVVGDTRPQAGPLPRPLVTIGAAVSAVLLVAGLALPVAALLPQVAPTQVALDIDVVNAWRNNEGQQLGSIGIAEDASVRRSLLQEDPVEVLRYTTDASSSSVASSSSYLRMLVLTRFDGETFSAPGENDVTVLPEVSFSDAREDGLAVSGDTSLLTDYDMTLTEVLSLRLPVPANVRAVSSTLDAVSEAITIDDVSGQVALSEYPALANGDGFPGSSSSTGQKLAYTVTAEESPATAAQLRAVPASTVGSPLEIGYLQASEVPDAARELADQLVESTGATTAYDTAIAFQDYFRTSFDYSLTVATPRGQDPLESFLADRIGYCEQFASTFALMMNSQGYSTRVVTGFTPGTTTADGEHVVSTSNAHAWPEVYFGPDYGWVRFEPTPAAAGNGVSAPDRETGTEDTATSEDTVATTAPAEETTAADEPTDAADTTETAASDASDQGGTTGLDAGEAASDALRGILGLIALAVLAVAALAVAVIVLRRRRDLARQARWDALTGWAGGADGGSGGSGGGPGGGAGPSAEEVRRRAGLLAWSEIRAELHGRHRAVAMLGWTGLWGRPVVDPVLSDALPPTQALTALLDEFEEHGVEVGDEHRLAAALIGSACAAARYAVPTWVAEERAARRTDSGADDGGADGAEAERIARDTITMPLQAETDVLLRLIRRAR
ncbi:DUF3488 and transglutaminase-like domain-containing protein [Brachybacterium sp. DNPG3]